MRVSKPVRGISASGRHWRSSGLFVIARPSLTACLLKPSNEVGEFVSDHQLEIRRIWESLYRSTPCQMITFEPIDAGRNQQEILPTIVAERFDLIAPNEHLANRRGFVGRHDGELADENGIFPSLRIFRPFRSFAPFLSFFSCHSCTESLSLLRPPRKAVEAQPRRFSKQKSLTRRKRRVFCGA